MIVVRPSSTTFWPWQMYLKHVSCGKPRNNVVNTPGLADSASTSQQTFELEIGYHLFCCVSSTVLWHFWESYWWSLCEHPAHTAFHSFSASRKGGFGPGEPMESHQFFQDLPLPRIFCWEKYIWNIWNVAYPTINKFLGVLGHEWIEGWKGLKSCFFQFII